MLRKLAVKQQLNSYDGWKKKHSYGRRWMVESSVSPFKRMLGEYVTSVKSGFL